MKLTKAEMKRTLGYYMPMLNHEVESGVKMIYIHPSLGTTTDLPHFICHKRRMKTIIKSTNGYKHMHDELAKYAVRFPIPQAA